MSEKEQGAFGQGMMIRFDYPAANFKGVRPRWEPRCIRVDCIRALKLHPLAPITVELQPNLDRGEVLVSGEDLQKNEPRSFYLEKMRNVEPMRVYEGSWEIVLCDNEHSTPEVIACAPSIYAAFAGLRVWLQQPFGFIVGLRRKLD